MMFQVTVPYEFYEHEQIYNINTDGTFLRNFIDKIIRMKGEFGKGTFAEVVLCRNPFLIKAWQRISIVNK